jgi:hypothetical protein
MCTWIRQGLPWPRSLSTPHIGRCDYRHNWRRYSPLAAKCWTPSSAIGCGTPPPRRTRFARDSRRVRLLTYPSISPKRPRFSLDLWIRTSLAKLSRHSSSAATRLDFWVAREANGRIGGIFLLRGSALSFAQVQGGRATIFPFERFELDLPNHGNPYAIRLVALMRFALALWRRVGRIGEAIGAPQGIS